MSLFSKIHEKTLIFKKLILQLLLRRNKLICLAVLFIFSAMTVYSQQQPFGLNIIQPKSFRYDFFQPTIFPSSFLKDSFNYAEKKIHSVTLYRDTRRVAENVYDSLGRLIRKFSYRGTDTSNILTITYYPDKTVMTGTDFFNRKKQSEGRSETLKNGTEIETRIYFEETGNGDSTKRIIETGNEVFYQMYRGGKVCDFVSRKYTPNNNLIYEEIKNYQGTHILQYNSRGSLIKDKWVYLDGSSHEQRLTYNEKNILINGIEEYLPKRILDSTLYFYDEADSLVKQVHYYKHFETKEQGTETEDRIYDNNHRLTEIKIIRHFNNSKDTSHVVVVYDGKSKNFTQYQYLYSMSNNPWNVPKIKLEFSGDTVIRTKFLAKDINNIINHSNFRNDSMYIPDEKIYYLHEVTVRQSFFRSGQWNLYFTRSYDSHGNLLEQSGNTEWQSGAYQTGGNLHCKYEYDKDGHCTRAIAMNDTGTIMCDFRLKLNTRGQILINECKDRFYGERRYVDSLNYDELGRLLYLYRYSYGDTTVVQNTYCGKFLCGYSESKNGKETFSMIAKYENDLPVREEIHKNDYYNKQGSITEWKYTFYK